MNLRKLSRWTLCLALSTPALAAGAFLSTSEVPADLRAATQGLQQRANQMCDEALRSLAMMGDPCSTTASLVGTATVRAAQESLLISFANCVNLTDRAEAHECVEEAWAGFQEELALVMEQFEARVEVCGLLGGGAYDPEIDPEDFENGVANPFFPLVPGTTWTYHNQSDEGLEVIVVTVTDETKEILGIECVVVSDTVTLDGVLIEDTLDYFAADEDGNIWYFGELVQNFEDGELVNLDGSFTAGVDGAKPGIVMPGAPIVGSTHRLEFYLGEAEDLATVLSSNESAVVPFGSFTGCLLTEDFTPIEPSALENKFFAPGVGFVLEVKPETGERLELVDVSFGDDDDDNDD